MQDEFLRLQKLLHKTIVFITHDFDEAIRLADRIAIMKDGGIDQIGTPEDLVVRPGHRLCRGVHQGRVPGQGSVGGLRDDARSEAAPGGRLWRRSAGRREDRRGREQDGRRREPFAVMGEDGKQLGQVTRDAVIDVLIQG